MSDTVVKIDPATLSPLHRQCNKALMVAWINADLFSRAHLDVTTAVVLYDGDKDFAYALKEMPDEKLMQQLRELTPVRFVSIGV